MTIDHFLHATASWTIRWFNKPKFHFLPHLREHIPRFGPAIAFHTEGFEAYNAIIRAWSIHSNRLAPSRDIARSAARFYQIRHIISGGYFHNGDQDNPKWVRAGDGPLAIGTQESIVTRKIGLEPRSKTQPGIFLPVKELICIYKLMFKAKSPYQKIRTPYHGMKHCHLNTQTMHYSMPA